MRGLYAAAVAAVLLAGAQSASAAILINGDFEHPGGEVRTQLGGGFTIPGWTYVSNGGQDFYEADDKGDGLAAADGNHYVSFGHNSTQGGSLSQTFATQVGGFYTLTYWVAEQQGDDSGQILRATIDNGGVLSSQDNASLPSIFQQGLSISFTATGSHATVTFLDATPAGGGGGSNLALDRVSVAGPSASGAPEPAAWALMIAGFGGAGAMLRRRRGQMFA
jgi:hypothetical protein